MDWRCACTTQARSEQHKLTTSAMESFEKGTQRIRKPAQSSRTVDDVRSKNSWHLSVSDQSCTPSPRMNPGMFWFSSHIQLHNEPLFNHSQAVCDLTFHRGLRISQQSHADSCRCIIAADTARVKLRVPGHNDHRAWPTLTIVRFRSICDAAETSLARASPQPIMN